MKFVFNKGIWKPLKNKAISPEKDLCDDEFYLLLKGMVEISNDAFPNAGEYFTDAEGLLLKCFYHAATFAFIAKGTDVKPLQCHFRDTATPNIIARAALETALTFHHIYCYPQTPELKELYYNMWIYKGLKVRHKREPEFVETPPSWLEEKEEIKRLKNRIVNDTYFLQMDPKKRVDNLKDNDWRIFIKDKNSYARPSWKKIAEIAGMGPKHADMVYSYLSEFGHSGYRSAMQIHQANSDEDFEALIGGTIDVVKIVISLMIKSYSQVMPPAKAKLNANDKLKSSVDLWLGISHRE